MDTLADRLRWVMKHKDWSASRLSREAGLARGHVGLILNGHVGERVAGDTLTKIAAAAGVTLEWLQNGAGDPLEVNAGPGVRWDEHPDWARVVGEAERKFPGWVPPFAYAQAGRMRRGSAASNLTPEIALQLARIWMDTATEDERATATSAWVRDQAARAAERAAGGNGGP